MFVQQLQQAINYMERHLLENITYVDVAKSMQMSGYTFHRAFSLITGMTANEYIRNRRLTLAARELQESDISVIDAAYKYGYESPESFSKAFSRFHGSTPKAAKRKGAKLHLFNPLTVKIIVEGGSIMDYRMEHKDSQRFLALARAFRNETCKDGNGHSIPDFWSECYDKDLIEPMRLLRPEGKRDLYGFCNPVKASETHFEYGIGVAVDEDTDAAGVERLLNQGYSLVESGPGDYAVFKCLGGDAEGLGELWGKFFKEFLPQTGYTQAEAADYELYPEQGEKGVFCELWIPVKKG